MQKARPATATSPPVPHDRPATGRGLWLGLTAAVLVLVGALWFRPPGRESGPQATPPVSTPAPSVPGAPAASDGTAATPTPAPGDTAIDQLAMVTPPTYVPMTTRSDAARDRTDLNAAMAHYVNGRYAEAARGLAPLVERAPELVHAQFFLGVSELAAGQIDRGRLALQRVVQSGISPFADDAHFYLAKAALADRRLDVAVDELTRAIDLKAGPAGEAARLLARVRALPR